MIFKFTGHPFVDAGIAGIAALLEQHGQAIASPEDITVENAHQAIDFLLSLYCQRIRKDEKQNEAMPLLYFLLQEVLPGSSWDQAKTGKNIAANKEAKFVEYIEELKKTVVKEAIGTCSITGMDAHITVDKSKIPLLASGGERPNCYPNLSEGFPASAWIALAVLFSPLSIEKTIKADGKGSKCLIYHSYDWQFMVEVAQRNLNFLNTLLAAKSIDEYYKENYKNKSRSGTWRMALSTILKTVKATPEECHHQVVVWNFNASNTSCHYEFVAVPDALLEIYNNRRIHTTAYRDILRCSNTVSEFILEGKPIASASIIEREAKKELTKADRLTRTILQPGWAFQRLYAEKVFKMSTRLLNTIEEAALFLSHNAQAVTYCLYDCGPRISIKELAGKYKLPGNFCAVFADAPTAWQDYLRAAVLWVAKGEAFLPAPAVTDEMGELERLIKRVSVRLREKHSYKRLAQKLSVNFPRRYRQEWIRLLNDGACGWEDFLAFNPLDEALSMGGYHRTRVMRDYLVAYLLGCKNEVDSETDVDEQQEDEVADSDLPFTFTDDNEEEEV